jgi:glyoxylase-like metal-dependent hydrolase (beta-lactamase superfamily II)
MIMQVGQPLQAVVDEGLGNSAYLVDLGDGRALVVDPPRDLRAIRALAARKGLRIVVAADTHLHADFLSGACQLAATDGARILASAAGNRAFAHHGLRDGDEVGPMPFTANAIDPNRHRHRPRLGHGRDSRLTRRDLVFRPHRIFEIEHHEVRSRLPRFGDGPRVRRWQK